MAIDVTQPLELDDGRTVTFDGLSKTGESFRGTFVGTIYRNGRNNPAVAIGVAWFGVENGYVGRDPNQVETYHTVRNVEDPKLYEPDL